MKTRTTHLITLLKLTVLLATPLLLLGLNTDIAFAWHNTPIQTETLYELAKMGTTTKYGYIGPSGDRHPQFYSALIADGCSKWGFLFYPELVKIEVSGTDPLGYTLAGDRFVASTIVSSPDDSGVEQNILKIIYDTLFYELPSGLKAIVKNTVTAGGATISWDSQKAWGVWQRPVWDTPSEERGLRFGYQLAVDPAREGTYTINIHYHAWICAYDTIRCYHFGYIDLYDTVYYEYVNTPPAPSTPSGTTSGIVGVSYPYSTHTTDPNGDDVRYKFDWGDGTTYLTPNWYSSGADATASHSWSSPGTYDVKVRAQDSTGTWSDDWSPPLTVNIQLNHAPNTPSTPVGPTSLIMNKYYTFTTKTTDPDGDQVCYEFSWGDGKTSTTGYYDSGATASAAHKWTSDGYYYIRVRAKDEYEAYSGWSYSLKVKVTYTCPTLFSWNGSEYVEEGILNIHSTADVTVDYPLTYLSPVGRFCRLSLRELDEFTSHIDYVKLYAVDADGEWHGCYLTLAIHSEVGSVSRPLKFDDGRRVDLAPQQTVDLAFLLPQIDEIDYFVFEINGYNPKPV